MHLTTSSGIDKYFMLWKEHANVFLMTQTQYKYSMEFLMREKSKANTKKTIITFTINSIRTIVASI